MKKILIHDSSKISETLILSILLAVVGGFTDAYTFLTRGGVLANAQTGNMVFFGFNLVNGNLKNSFYYFIPIFAFFVGILVAEFIRNSFSYNKIHWKQIIILIEIILLIICSFIPKGNLDVYVNITISFFCALQVQTFRITNSNVVTTTMCTGNLRSGTEQLYLFLTKKDKDLKEKAKENVIIYFGLIFFFIIGAVIGTFSCDILDEKALLVCCLILSFVFSILFKEKINDK